MNLEIATQALAMKQAQTQQLAQIKMLKAAHDMQRQLVDMIAEVTASAPVPEHVGTRVDKSA